MNLANLTVNVRPLTSYQAIDLGLMMAREWFMPLWSLWWRRMLPVFIGVAVVIWGLGFLHLLDTSDKNVSFWVGVFLWWVKPYAEVPSVIYLSQKLFDKDYTPEQAYQQARQLPFKNILLLLTRHRITLRRQILMPILLLEQQDQAHMNARLRILSQSQGSGITWHTMVFSLLEIIGYLGLLVLVSQLIPEGLVSDGAWFEWLKDAPTWLDILMYGVSMLVVSIASPFYIASGFGLYICKRSLLEGWDIELKFRKLAQRYEEMRANQPLFSNTNQGGK